jgi:hypothetical protein
VAFIKSTVATNNISNLPNKPLITATALKQKFDQYGADDKTYTNGLIDQLELTTPGSSGAENIGSATVSGLAGNTIWAQISALWTAVQNIVIGTLPDNSVTNDKIATASKIGLLADLTTSVKTNIVAAINSISLVLGDGTVTWPKLAPDMQNRELMQDKAITELLMLADIDSKVFSPNLGKFYTNFSTVMDYSLGAIDATKQMYTGALSAGATNVILPSVTGFAAGQEISIQDSTNYEDVIIQSVVGSTVNFKSGLINSYDSPSVYRSGNTGNDFGTSTPPNAVFGLHCDGDVTDFIGTTVPESNTSTSDTTNKKFGTASRAFNGSQYIQYSDSELWELGSGNWYFDMQIKHTAQGSLKYLMGQTDSSGLITSSSIQVTINANNTVTVTVNILGNNYNVTSTGTLSSNSVFYNLRFGRNGTSLHVAINGVVSGTVSVPVGSVNNSPNKFCIGRIGEVTNNYFVGNIDEFLFVKGVPMNSTDFAAPSSPYGASVLLKTVIRMNITPYEDVKYISAWLTKTDLAGFTADGKLSIVDASADESYVDLTESITDLGATQEVMMIGNSATADSKVTLKLTLDRASTSDSVSFTKLIGGVSA